MNRHLEPGRVRTRHRLFARTLATAVVVDAQYEPRQRIAPHSHRLPHCTYVVSGEYFERADGHERVCTAGDLLFHRDNEIHSETIGREGARCLNIEFLFKEPVVRALSAAVASATSVKLATTVARDEANCGWPDGTNAIRHTTKWAEQIYRNTEHAVWQAVVRTAPAWLAKCVQELDAHLADPLRLSVLARLAGVHRTHVVRGFRGRLGQTPGEYMRARRIAKACKLLASSDASLVEIALLCGFSDQPHFTKTFREAAGKTPGEFRRDAAENKRY
jgi:AraC family transcriptional regulator